MRSSTENRIYYQAHKDEINRLKREKYKKDKAYRDSAKKRSKDQTLLKKINRITERATVLHNGRVETSHTLTELCKAIDRSRHVVFHWRYAGVMPKPTHFVGDKGIYSESQFKLMQYLFGMVDSGKEISYRQISAALHRFWDKTFSVKALSNLKGANNGKDSGSEKRKTGSGNGDQGREECGKKDRASDEVRRAKRCSRSKSGSHVEHGKLRKPETRCLPIAALQARSSQRRVGV
jgi:hypothetical protein